MRSCLSAAGRQLPDLLQESVQQRLHWTKPLQVTNAQGRFQTVPQPSGQVARQAASKNTVWYMVLVVLVSLTCCDASCLQGLVFMVTNIDEEAHGRFHLWGVTADGQSVLVRVTDFRPYFLIAAPALQVSASDMMRAFYAASRACGCASATCRPRQPLNPRLQQV